MKDATKTALGVAALLLLVTAYASYSTAQTRPVTIARGFEFNVFADPERVPEFSFSFSGPTALAFDSRGRLFVATYSGRILILLDNDDDGNVDQVKTFTSGIPIPLGLEFRGEGELFATSNVFGGPGRIVRLRDTDGDDVADEVAVLLDGLPSEGDHQTDRLKFGPDGLLYFGQGSSTDNGQAKEGRPPERPLNAKILRFDVETQALSVFASGLRNPFGMAFHPENGALFATDGGSGEFCTFDCPNQPAPHDEVNWVVEGGNYGFPNCEGTPSPDRPQCVGVRPPVTQFLPHLTPTSIAFYTGPQAGEAQNQMLVTIYKHLFGQGGDLRRFTVAGDPDAGFQLTEVKPPIADFGIIDPFDGPVDTAIDPISGDIYVARFDPVNHPDPNEHHHFIYRIHRQGSDSQPFIGRIRPSEIKAGSGASAVSLIGRHVEAGAVVLADGTPVETLLTGATELTATLPAEMLVEPRTVGIVVQNPDGSRSNLQTLVITENIPSPDLSSLAVRKKARIIPNAVAGTKAKKHRLIAIGTDFDQGAELLVEGSPLVLESASSTELVGRFTAAMIATPGELTVQVLNSTGRVSNTLKLVIVAQAQ